MGVLAVHQRFLVSVTIHQKVLSDCDFFFIAGDATLVFEIELFEFHGEDVTKNTDLGVVKRIKVNGDGWDMPNDGAQMEVKICGKVQDKVFDERTVKFELGEGIEEGIPRGVEMALEKMKVCLLINYLILYSSQSQLFVVKF